MLWRSSAHSCYTQGTNCRGYWLLQPVHIHDTSTSAPELHLEHFTRLPPPCTLYPAPCTVHPVRRRTYIALISACARASKSDAAYQLYRALRGQGLEADGRSGSALITSLCQAYEVGRMLQEKGVGGCCGWHSVACALALLPPVPMATVCSRPRGRMGSVGVASLQGHACDHGH